MILYILLAWYLLGVIGGFILSKWNDPDDNSIEVMDVLMNFTVGGLFGLITLYIGIKQYYDNSDNNFLHRKIIKDTSKPKPKKQ
jgi:hypothetical protein